MLLRTGLRVGEYTSLHARTRWYCSREGPYVVAHVLSQTAITKLSACPMALSPVAGVTVQAVLAIASALQTASFATRPPAGH